MHVPSVHTHTLHMCAEMETNQQIIIMNMRCYCALSLSLSFSHTHIVNTICCKEKL